VTRYRLLAADLAHLLAQEPDGLPCDTLALQLRRRRADVLSVLRDDPRFARISGARRSRWRLTDTTQDSQGRIRDGLERHANPHADSRVIPELVARVERLERLVDVLAERQNGPAPV
jgi:hypothetical protein